MPQQKHAGGRLARDGRGEWGMRIVRGPDHKGHKGIGLRGPQGHTKPGAVQRMLGQALQQHKEGGEAGR